ncbi:MAG: 4-(cytidine 5'-diphospho)-2-C-methyl-D-erythritol kinase [Clostridia bacterium]|nr:4-(cytidine 5'-diphospho)-2-C-methyl-D-erythritol kinase [Clostridia bacterium]
MNYFKELISGNTVEIRDKAYAKINLFLDVVAKRNDGYHDIRSYMHSVSLCDDLKLCAKMSKKATVSITVEGNASIPDDHTNLACRAATAYMEWSGISLDVKIELTKRIPTEAGLGGGSTDAASVLRMLNVIMANNLSAAELSMVAAGIGADVPYCLFGGTKLCEGKGEILTDVALEKPLYFVIAKSEESVSTPAMYKMLDTLYGDFDGFMNIEAEMKHGILSHALKRGDLFDISAGLYNIFESVVLDECPQARRLKEILLTEGAMAALMSGSGPSVYGIFADKNKAISVAEKLGDIAFFAESV